MVVVEEFTDAFTTSNAGVGHRSSEEAYFRASELLAKDAILFAQKIDQVFLLAVQPPSHGQDEELQSMRHRQSLRGSGFRHSQDRPFSQDPTVSAAFLHPTGLATICENLCNLWSSIRSLESFLLGPEFVEGLACFFD